MGIFLHDRESPNPLSEQAKTDDEIMADTLGNNLKALSLQLEAMAESVDNACTKVRKARSKLPKNVSSAWDKEYFKVLSKLQGMWKEVEALTQRVHNVTRKL
jgi:uncharacterized protein YqfA (UPF0365 family)